MAIVTVLSGCDGERLIITDPLADQPLLDDAATVPATGSATGSNTLIGTPSFFIDDEASDNDASTGTVAAAFLAVRAAQGSIKIMAVGDSITHGVAGMSSYRRELTALMQAASCSYTMVGSQLTSDSADNSSADGYHGAHEGYSSNRADHFLTGYDSSAGSNPGIRVSMETYRPDVVLLHVGSFDVFNQQGVGNALNDIEELLETIYRTQSETLVLIANVIPWFSESPYPGIARDIESLGDRIEEMVLERFDPLLKLVDVRSGYTESMMLNDLIHPNPVGENHIADAFMDVYQRLANCSSG